MNCKCCGETSDLRNDGFCVKCFLFLSRRDSLFDEVFIEHYRVGLKLLRICETRPYTKNEIQQMSELIIDGTLERLPTGFWKNKFTYDNCITCLEYWCLDILKIDPNDLKIYAIKRKIRKSLKDSLFSGILLSSKCNFNNVYRDLLKRLNVSYSVEV